MKPSGFLLIGLVSAALIVAFAPTSAQQSETSNAPAADLAETGLSLGCPSQGGACPSQLGSTCPSSLAKASSPCCSQTEATCAKQGDCCQKTGEACQKEGGCCKETGQACEKQEDCCKMAQACTQTSSCPSAALGSTCTQSTPDLKGALSLGGCCASAQKSATGSCKQRQAASCPSSMSSAAIPPCEQAAARQ